MRLYAELGEVLDRDAIVIGDGGDFVSYAGRVIDSYQPGCWLDPGPFGCLGTGPGYALAAKLAHPERQVVLMLGDGAFGFSGMEFDTLARHGVNVVAVMGNNGIWALEKHPMEFLYGYSVAAELRPETRYDEVVEALGGYGELVRSRAGRQAGAGARVLVGQAGAGERADRPERRLPAQVQPRLSCTLARERPDRGGGAGALGVSRRRRGAARRRAGCRALRLRRARARTRAAPRSSTIMPATIVGARSGCRPTTSRRCCFVHVGQAREQQFDRCRAAGHSRRRARGRTGRAPGRSTAAEVAVPATAMPRATGSRSRAGRPSRKVWRTSAASCCSSSGAGGSEWMWRSLMRTTPACSET